MFTPEPRARRGRARPGVPARRQASGSPTGRPKASSARCSRSSAQHVPPPAGVPSPLRVGHRGPARASCCGADPDRRSPAATSSSVTGRPSDFFETFKDYYGPMVKAWAKLDDAGQRIVPRSADRAARRHNRATGGGARRRLRVRRGRRTPHHVGRRRAGEAQLQRAASTMAMADSHNFANDGGNDGCQSDLDTGVVVVPAREPDGRGSTDEDRRRHLGDPPGAAGAGQPLDVYINSMVILGSEPVIVDTGTPANRKQWLEDVFSLVEPEDVRWIFLSHDDVDHTGNLDEAMAVCPNANVVCNWAMVERHTNCFDFPLASLPVGDATGSRSTSATGPCTPCGPRCSTRPPRAACTTRRPRCTGRSTPSRRRCPTRTWASPISTRSSGTSG